MWTWETVEQQAFDNLRQRVTAEPVLKQPKLDKLFELEVNTLGFAVGAVLLQCGKDNTVTHKTGAMFYWFLLF